MKLSDYYSIKRQEYVTFKLIPTKSSRNNTTIGIAHLINSLTFYCAMCIVPC